MNDIFDTDDSEHKLNLRNLTLDDYEQVQKIMNFVYPRAGGSVSKDKFIAQL